MIQSEEQAKWLAIVLLEAPLPLILHPSSGHKNWSQDHTTGITGLIGNPNSSRTMSRHSKNNTARGHFTYAEKQMLDYGTKKVQKHTLTQTKPWRRHGASTTATDSSFVLPWLATTRP